ncbi:hypothetical protein [Dethiosulfatarculus sandiegensis]|uniref:Uncharacterized protein n=1 Tax=Dethiosulfatarculus sandiegensis TaxID=1429043 RepID=A0A0D2HKU2_9BACT|nr:hypothetical protein [Dethiosulfatarculus sandiegensis]KIX11273.1 hypothetical protein X474_26205 [Dethiosulfatarculus sandiegensis]
MKLISGAGSKPQDVVFLELGVILVQVPEYQGAASALGAMPGSSNTVLRLNLPAVLGQSLPPILIMPLMVVVQRGRGIGVVVVNFDLALGGLFNILEPGFSGVHYRGVSVHIDRSHAKFHICLGCPKRIQQHDQSNSGS